jgi:hypothetical protein
VAIAVAIGGDVAEVAIVAEVTAVVEGTVEDEAEVGAEAAKPSQSSLVPTLAVRTAEKSPR